MRNNTINKQVEHILKNWGNYLYQDLVLDSVGYPSKSIEGKLIDGGGVIITSTSKHGRVLIDSHLIAVNQIVGDLLSDKSEKTTGVVLQLNYISQLPQKRKAAFLNMALSQYQYYLRSGRLYVAGRLNIKNS